jgi:hypothetical protein
MVERWFVVSKAEGSSPFDRPVEHDTSKMKQKKKRKEDVENEKSHSAKRSIGNYEKSR